MKELKYIKLFEAFESIKLSKTLNFIDKDSRSSFLSDIKSLCADMDFPLSKISDDLFEYLPYKRAIEYHKDIVEVPCTATSESEFNSSISIPGEKCEGGKLKRTWGAGRVRVITCPNCNGTGIEPFVPSWQYLKFWFGINKKHIAKTSTNGTELGEGSFKYDVPVKIWYGDIRKRDMYWDENSMNKLLKNADFALVLDLDKLKGKLKEVESTSDTKLKRGESRVGALALKSNEDIKRANIERYFNQLIDRSEIKGNLDDIKNINKLFMRILCGNRILFALYPGSDINALGNINNISESIYDIMYSLQKDNSQENQNKIIRKVEIENQNIKSCISISEDCKIRIKKSLEFTNSYFKYNLKENKSIKILDNIMEINNHMYRYFSNYKVENLYDFESLLADLTLIHHSMKQKRYLYKIGTFFTRSTSRWGGQNAKDYISSIGLDSSDIDDALEGTERFISFLKNRYSL